MLPSNRGHRTLDVRVVDLPRDVRPESFLGGGFDDAATIATAHNFARDGFLRTHLLPNRARAPLASFWDLTRTMCESLGDSPLMKYVNPVGKAVTMHSLNGDCVYTHYPPLADWIYGLLASLGFHEVVHYKTLAILLNLAFLALLFLWLRGEVGEWSALASVALAAWSPAFLQWADALFYQPFQYLFLIAGLLAWKAALRSRRPRHIIATWLLFLLESLVSYELTLFFGIVLVGISALEATCAPRRWLLSRLAVQMAAPLAGFALHFGLRVSLFGFSRTWNNLTSTIPSRFIDGLSFSNLYALNQDIGRKLMPLWLFALAIVLVLLVRRAAGFGLRRPLALLGILLAGGLSFALIFPGMFLWHHWTMYRHLMLFTVYLTALLTEALVIAVGLLKNHLRHGRNLSRAIPILTCFAAGVGIVVWLVERDVREVRIEVAWDRSRNLHHDVNNLVAQLLDVVYWWDRPSPLWERLYHVPVDGQRVNRWLPESSYFEFRTKAQATSHYEIWWLEDIPLRRYRVLTNLQDSEALSEDCFLSYFDGSTFQRSHTETRVTRYAFAPQSDEPQPRIPYAWVEFLLPSIASTRVARLTCGGREPHPMHEIEAFAD